MCGHGYERVGANMRDDVIWAWKYASMSVST